MKEGLPGDTLRVFTEERARGGPCSCCTLDWISVASGSTSACSPRRARSSGELAVAARRRWPARPGGAGRAVRGAGARGDRVDDRRAVRARHARSSYGWEVLIADAQKVKGLAPLACKTDRIDARVLAVLSQRDLVPAIWLPDPRVRRERELARFRLHLVKHKLEPEEPHPLDADHLRAPVPGHRSVRRRRPRAARPARGPASRGAATIDASLQLIDDLERQIAEINRELKRRRRRPPLRPAAADRAGDRLGAGLHDRRRDRRHQPLRARRRSCPATPACARACTSPASNDRRGPLYQARAPSTCAGRCSRRPCTPCATPPTRALPAQQAPAGQASAAPRSPRSTSPESSPRRSGTCSPATSPSPPLRRRRFSSGRLTALSDLRPRSRASNFAWSSRRGGDRDMSAARHPTTARGP